jgi:23S rRNA (cytosine1962-C5)-methyltransferase
MTELSILVADDWTDYALLDSGDGCKLERAGGFTFVRPEPQALWRPHRPASEWDRADAIFAAQGGSGGDDDEAGRWRFNRPLPERWPLAWRDLRFLSRPTPFRHLAFFPEHSVHWRFARARIAARPPGSPPAEILNLFGYTGLATLACAAQGAKVTHVDASKKAIGMARDNQAHAGLAEAPVRWIADDALTFVKREVRRGRRYDGIILDPPKYGRGPNGEVWRLEDGLGDLLASCAAALALGGFVIATLYAVRLSALALDIAMREAFGAAGEWQVGEMGLPHADDARILPTAIFARAFGLNGQSPPR